MNTARVDLRIGGGSGSRVFQDLTPAQAVTTLRGLAAESSAPLVVSVRPSQRGGAVFIGWTDREQLAQARGRGFEPAAVVDDRGRLGVWVVHAPAPEAVRPYLDRSVRLAYGQSPETHRRFGPLAGFCQEGCGPARLLSAAGRSYSQAGPLAAALTAAQAERAAMLGAKLRACAVPSLGTFETAIGGKKRDAAVEWARLALGRGLSQPDVLSVLVTQVSKRSSSPKGQLAYATKILAAALGSTPQSLAPTLLRAAASTAGLTIRILTVALKLVRLGQKLNR